MSRIKSEDASFSPIIALSPLGPQSQPLKVLPIATAPTTVVTVPNSSFQKSNKTAKHLSYFNQLNGLRALAVALVLADHWLADRNILPLGPLGVTIFFVLSGFLITRILLSSKDSLVGQSKGLSQYLKVFYVRRTLRIFPLYYACLLVLFLTNIPAVRETFGWTALYATNIYIATKQTWIGSIDHFWSLAVEEQVYLFFPLLLFFVPRRYVPLTMLLMISGSVFYRYQLFQHGQPWMISYVSTIACLDSFGLGSLLAFIWLYKRGWFNYLFQNSVTIIVFLVIYGLTVLASKLYYTDGHNFVSEVWERLAGSLLGMALIGRATFGFDGGMKWILDNPVSHFLGQISYGIYLFHNLVFNPYHTPATHPTSVMWNKLTHAMPLLGDHILFKLIYLSALTVGLATLSWYLLEKPINNLKSRFSYA